MPPFLQPLAVLLPVAQGQGASTPAEVIVQILPLLLIGLAAWALLIKPERDRYKRQQEVLAGLKKNDRVLTSSGIFGTVALVDRDSGRVVLKIDDTANVKMQVALSSIATVLDASGESTSSAA